MALTLKITDGTTEVSLLNPSGFALSLDGYNPGILVPGYDTEEKFIARLKGVSHNNLASQVQQLQRLFRKAEQFNWEHWQETPVYIQAQTSGETYARYAVIKAGNINPMRSPYQLLPFGTQNYWLDIEITLIREGYWCAEAPLTVPATSNLGNGGQDNIIGYGGAAERLSTGAFVDTLEGDYHGVVRVDGAGTEAYWIHGNVETATEDTIAIEFLIDLQDLEMANGDKFDILRIVDLVPNLYLELTLEYNSTPYWILSGNVYNDAFTPTTLGSDNFTQSQIGIRVIWVAATSPGANDGYVQVYVDKGSGYALELSVSNIDNDTHSGIIFWIGAVANLDAGTIGYIYFDQIRWGWTYPTWEATQDFEGQLIPQVGSCNYYTRLTHIFNYSPTFYSANRIGTEDFELFELSKPAVVNDAVYFGSTEGAWFAIPIVFKTALVATGVTFAVEYWDGADWNNTDVGALLPWTEVGNKGAIYFIDKGLNWAKTTVNSVNAYWIRIRVTAVTTWTTSPEYDGYCKTINKSYFEIPANEIAGDVPSKTLIRLMFYSEEAHDGIGQVMIGVKSRGLKNFVPQLHSGGGNPLYWSRTLGTDTTYQTSKPVPGDQYARCTFATNTLAERLTWSATDEDTVLDFEGVYRIFLQLTCTDDTVHLRLKLKNAGVEQIGEMVHVGGEVSNEYPQIVDLGRFDILPLHVRGDESHTGYSLDFILEAEADTTTPNIDIFTLMLVPIDEWATSVSYQGLTNQLLTDDGYISIDSGVLRKGASDGRWSDSGGVFSYLPLYPWAMGGELPNIEPQKNTRFYVFPMEYDVTEGQFSVDRGVACWAQFHHVDRWAHLRGSD